jgi:hypothetical protein
MSVTGRRGLQGCDMLRISHFLDNRLIDGAKPGSLMYRLRSTPQEYYLVLISVGGSK